MGETRPLGLLSRQPGVEGAVVMVIIMVKPVVQVAVDVMVRQVDLGQVGRVTTAEVAQDHLLIMAVAAVERVQSVVQVQQQQLVMAETVLQVL